MNMITKFGSHILGTAASTEKGIKNLLGNEVEFSSCHLQENIEDGCKENEGRVNANIQTMQKTQSSIKGSHGLSESNEKRKTLIKKAVPTDRLWDGYLQLNSSVTVSAVAFYKSGEKMPDVKWSESVEVKGQVKLDDFEKYVQDLPRSRNRGMMVVSLLWKEGSSKLAFAGMKKVAKRYEEVEKVGFGRILSGIDLYVCPRSDKIITILARHGFFKGRKAIEENKDALIGCVVWRRNQINLNFVQQRSKKFTHQVALSNKSPTPLPSEESLESLQKNHTALDVTKQKDRIEKDMSLSILPLVSAGREISYQEPENQQVRVGQSSKLEFRANKSGVEQQNLSFRQPRPVLVLPPPDVAKQPSLILDSEDLPEFDFGSACGLTPSHSMPPQKRRLHTHSMPPQKKVRIHDNISQLPLLVDRESRAEKNPCNTLVAPPAKSRFNDDDMPEWCPPDVDVKKQSNLVTNQLPKIPIPSVKPNFVHSIQAAGATNLFSPARVHRPQFSNLSSHFTFLGPVDMQKHAQPGSAGIQIGKVMTSKGHQL